MTCQCSPRLARSSLRAAGLRRDSWGDDVGSGDHICQAGDGVPVPSGRVLGPGQSIGGQVPQRADIPGRPRPVPPAAGPDLRLPLPAATQSCPHASRPPAGCKQAHRACISKPGPPLQLPPTPVPIDSAAFNLIPEGCIVPPGPAPMLELDHAVLTWPCRARKTGRPIRSPATGLGIRTEESSSLIMPRGYSVGSRGSEALAPRRRDRPLLTKLSARAVPTLGGT